MNKFKNNKILYKFENEKFIESLVNSTDFEKDRIDNLAFVDRVVKKSLWMNLYLYYYLNLLLEFSKLENLYALNNEPTKHEKTDRQI